MEGRESSECPVSLLSLGNGPGMVALVREVLDAETVYAQTGVYAGGPDSHKWSCIWFDLVKMSKYEKFLVDAAREELRDAPR